MAKSRRDGLRGLPKVPNVMKVMWELYCALSVDSPFCLFRELVVNKQYVMNLQQKVRWVRTWLDGLEGGLVELEEVAVWHGPEVVEQQQPGAQFGTGELQLGVGDPGLSPSEVEDRFRQEAEAPGEVATTETTPCTADENEVP